MTSAERRKLQGRLFTLISKMQELKELEVQILDADILPSSFEGALQDLIYVYMYGFSR